MAVHSMFSVPVIHYQIANWDLNKKKILDALPPETPEHADPQDNGLYTDFFLTAAAGNQELPDYFNTVLGVIKPYLADFTDERRLEFVDMWYQKYYKNVEHKDTVMDTVGGQQLCMLSLIQSYMSLLCSTHHLETLGMVT